MSRGRVLRVGAVVLLFAAGIALGPNRGAQASGIGVTYSVADANANEGSASTPGVMTFTVTAGGTFFSGETVHYQTTNGSALAGVDYEATSGDLAFSAAGSKTVPVTLIGDATIEPDKTFNLVLSANSSISDDAGVGTVKNDDFTVSVGDTSVTEGNSGSVNASVQITLSAVRSADTTVHYETTNGSATAGPDYTASSGTATVPAGAQSTIVNIPVAGDVLYEDDETFTVTLSAPSSPVTIDDGIATVTILADDNAPPPDDLPKLSIENGQATESDDGTHTVTFNVKLSGATSHTVTVTATTSDGTAKAPGDYEAKSSHIVFSPATGPQSKAFSVAVKGDTLDEADETFNATLSSPDAAVLDEPAKTAAMTVIDDDPTPALSVADAQSTEGGKVHFALTLASPAGRDLVIAVATQDGTAISPTDFTPVSGTATVPAGQTSVSVDVQTASDEVAEAAETFRFKATLDGVTDEAVGTITDSGGGGSAPRAQFITTGAGAGAGAHVRVFDATGAPQPPEGFFPYRDGPGVRVARGDLDGDGHDEIIVAPGPGDPPLVRVYAPNGSSLIAQIDAYQGFSGGVFIAAGDVDGDGRDEVITSAGPGGGPHVRTFKLVGASLTGSPGFFGARSDFAGGLTVAAGDVNGDHVDEIVLGAATADQPVVYVWNYTPTTNAAAPRTSPFLAYGPDFRGGITVAAGDLDGDGKAEIVTGAGPGGGPHVRVFSGGGGGLPGSAYAYDAAFTGGVLVGIGDVDGNGNNEIITAAGPGGGPHVRTFNVAMQPGTTSFYAYGPQFGGGVFVAAGRP